MILGLSVPQDLFANVARTSFDVGTLSTDIVRALRYSKLSKPAWTNVSSLAWKGSGYPDLDVGFSANRIDLPTPWLGLLKSTIANGIPIIVLQQFLPTDASGHFRVVFGYNSTHIFTKDPWGREDQPNNYIIPNDVFLQLWSYVEAPLGYPRYFGAAAVPWALQLSSGTSGNMLIIDAIAKYSTPFPPNMLSDAATAERIIFEVTYDPAVWIANQDSVSRLQSLTPGSTASQQFALTCLSSNMAGCVSSPIFVRVSGIISGHLPSTIRSGTLRFAPYDYVDQVGSLWTQVVLN